MEYKFFCIVNFFLFIICINTYAGVLNNDSNALTFIINELDVKNFSKSNLKNVKKFIVYRNTAIIASNLMHQHVSQTSSKQHQHNAKYYSYRCKALGNQNDLIQKLVLTWAYMQHFNSKKNTNKNTMISKFDVQEVLKSILQRIITTIDMQSKKHLKTPICLTNVCISEALTAPPPQAN